MHGIVLAPETKQIAAARKQPIFQKPPENPTLGEVRRAISFPSGRYDQSIEPPDGSGDSPNHGRRSGRFSLPRGVNAYLGPLPPKKNPRSKNLVN
jgi:hypothetical protein